MLKILFENSHFIIVDKPSGWLAVPSRAGRKDPRPCVGYELKNILPVHRLDFEVSGILMFAKTKEAQAAANSWFEKHEVVKTYSALTEGEAREAEKIPEGIVWESLLVRGKKRAFEAPHGKKALTRVWYEGSTAEGLKWRLQPLTGRSHQLRYELSKRKFPILGDVLYGGSKLDRADFIELRAVEISFLDCSEHSRFELPHVVSLYKN